MKILITGAHFTPAVAVIEELLKYKDVQVVYVGRRTTMEGDKSQSIESQMLPLMGVKFIPIITGRLQRIFTRHTISSLLKIPVGFLQSVAVLLSEKPDVILSFGGYVSVPIVIAGWLFSIPIIIHEQTLVSGLANRISAIFADKICLGFSQNDFSKKDNVILTGNPIRAEILDHQGKLDPEFEVIFQTARRKKLPVILVTGGNQGSRVINLAVEKVIGALTKIACVVHVTGDNKFQDFERLNELSNDNYLVKKWIGFTWGNVLSKVNLVISRGGINSLSEIAYLGKPAIVIPIPYLYKNEQMENAKFFQKMGFINILSQSNLSGENLLNLIKSMLKNINSLNAKARKSKEIIIPDAAKRLALETVLLENESR